MNFRACRAVDLNMTDTSGQNTSSSITLADMTDTHANVVASRPGAIDSMLDIGLLILRLGIGAAILQAGLIKASDFAMTVQFMSEAGWRVPAFAAFMVTATETVSGVALLLGVLTPLAGCATLGAMLCAWAVNVSGAAFWSEPFNVPFFIGLGGAALLFAGAGAYSVDSRVTLTSDLVTAGEGGPARAGLRCCNRDLGGALRRQPDPLHRSTGTRHAVSATRR